MSEYEKVLTEMLVVLEHELEFNEQEKAEAFLLILKILEDEELFE